MKNVLKQFEQHDKVKMKKVSKAIFFFVILGDKSGVRGRKC